MEPLECPERLLKTHNMWYLLIIDFRADTQYYFVSKSVHFSKSFVKTVENSH